MNETISFSHRGNLGDIIYSLPAVKACCHNHNAKANMILVCGAPTLTAHHPFGNVMMPFSVAKMLEPLLQHLDFVENVEVIHYKDFKTESAMFCLDDFRDMPDIDYDKGNIPEWYIHLFNKYYQEEIIVDLKQPYITVEPANYALNYIGVCRSARYRNDEIDYAPLNVFGDRLVFFGLEDEFKIFRKTCPASTFMKFNNFYILAKTMAGCSVFFGNQTFLYSLAEGMKIKRFLEVSPKSPNVQPVNNGTKIMNQKDFENAVVEILNFKS